MIKSLTTKMDSFHVSGNNFLTRFEFQCGQMSFQVSCKGHLRYSHIIGSITRQKNTIFLKEIMRSERVTLTQCYKIHRHCKSAYFVSKRAH